MKALFSHFRLRAMTLLGVVCLFCFTRGSEPKAFEDRFEISPAYDGSILAGSVALFYLAQHEFKKLTPVNLARLSRSDIPEFERWAVDYHSERADFLSDMAVLGVFAPIGTSLFLSQKTGNYQILSTDLLMFSQAMVLSSALNLWVRSMGNRPRPFIYNPDVPPDQKKNGESSSSLYSGHSSASFLTAVYTSYVFQQRHPDSKWNKWVWGLSLSAAGSVGGLRIFAGKHYISDVLAGAAAGSLFGFFVPWLHLKNPHSETLDFIPIKNGIGINCRF